MVGLIAVAIIGAVMFLSGGVKGTFNKTGNAMVSVAAPASGAAVSPQQAWCIATYPGSTYYAFGPALEPERDYPIGAGTHPFLS